MSRGLKIVLLHDEVGPAAGADERDVYVQMGAIESALAELGHSHARLPFGLDMQRVAASLRAAAPDLVFNLVESVGGQGRLIHLAPSLLDSLRVPYTGCPADAVYTTSNKLLAKRLLRGQGIATPEWVASDRVPGAVSRGRWILKSVWEHASRGLDEGSVVEPGSPEDLLRALSSRSESLAHEGFAERFIDGREFNLSVLDGRVLPPAEIVFEGYGPERLRVVGYKAKWDEGSYEYQHTPRRFDFAPADRPLLDELAHLAERCWSLFGLRGYARVDFRVDEAGRPWVLEVNTNPCLSPDAGFAAALERAGIPFAEAVSRVLSAARGPARGAGPAQDAPAPRRAPAPVAFRDEPGPGDPAAVREIVASTGFFHGFEVDVAVELVDERLARGLASEYFFLFADDPATGRPLGYACFGPIGCTAGSYDLYWIAVRNDQRARGLGRAILDEAERRIRAGLPNPARPDELVAGRKVYAETSSTARYAPTRRFYLRSGYREEARLADFYAPGDDKLVYVKTL